MYSLSYCYNYLCVPAWQLGLLYGWGCLASRHPMAPGYLSVVYTACSTWILDCTCGHLPQPPPISTLLISIPSPTPPTVTPSHTPSHCHTLIAHTVTPSHTPSHCHTLIAHTVTSSHTQINKRGKVQDRALLVTDVEIFKLDPRKHFQRKKAPLPLATVIGVSVSPALDQGVIVHFQNRKDLVFFMVNPHLENRVSELVAVLCQICQR